MTDNQFISVHLHCNSSLLVFSFFFFSYVLNKMPTKREGASESTMLPLVVVAADAIFTSRHFLSFIPFLSFLSMGSLP
jgi:hypothetical protein